MKNGLGTILVAAALLAPATALANGSGLSGYSGKPSTFSPQGESCNQCHDGGTAPTVSITGPDTLAAGQAAEYALVVRTGQTRAAGGVAATDGALLSPLAGFRDSFGEMVQDAALAVNNGEASFRFRVTAPATGGPLRLWAVGLAANGNGAGGDRATQMTRDITVTGGVPAKPDAGASTSSSSSGGASSSSSSSGSSGTSPDGGVAAGSGSSAGDDDGDGSGEDDAADPGRRGLRSASSGGACAVERGSVRTTGLFVFAALGVLLLSRRRRWTMPR